VAIEDLVTSSAFPGLFGDTTFARPAGYGTTWDSGDRVLCYLTWYDNGTPPGITGFTPIRTVGTQAGGGWYYKEATASEPANYTLTGTSVYTVHSIVVRGAVAPTANDGHSAGNTGTGTTRTGSAVTAGTSGALLLLGVTGYDSGSGAVSGMTEIADDVDVNNAWYQEGLGSGSTGTRTATGTSSPWATVMLVLDEEGGGGGGPPPFCAFDELPRRPPRHVPAPLPEEPVLPPLPAPRFLEIERPVQRGPKLARPPASSESVLAALAAALAVFLPDEPSRASRRGTRERPLFEQELLPPKLSAPIPFDEPRPHRATCPRWLAPELVLPPLSVRPVLSDVVPEPRRHPRGAFDGAVDVLPPLPLRAPLDGESPARGRRAPAPHDLEQATLPPLAPAAPTPAPLDGAHPTRVRARRAAPPQEDALLPLLPAPPALFEAPPPRARHDRAPLLEQPFVLPPAAAPPALGVWIPDAEVPRRAGRRRALLELETLPPQALAPYTIDELTARRRVRRPVLAEEQVLAAALPTLGTFVAIDELGRTKAPARHFTPDAGVLGAPVRMAHLEIERLPPHVTPPPPELVEPFVLPPLPPPVFFPWAPEELLGRRRRWARPALLEQAAPALVVRFVRAPAARHASLAPAVRTATLQPQQRGSRLAPRDPSGTSQP
jgi:hypothetical protein